MKISLQWLNDYLYRPVDADQVERLLTEQGFPVDERQLAAGDDVVLDVEVTSNRSDCLSHIGMAREVVAGFKADPSQADRDQQLQPPRTGGSDDAATGDPIDQLAHLENEAIDLCPTYTARVICGVKVTPSPSWLVQRLEAAGLRSVNNVVDVTNFVLLELGQPLHAFDLARLEKRRIVVRRARDGESFTAIDGSHHTLDNQMLAIADGVRAVAVAGVMGGLDSEVGHQTVDVLLESARFDPVSVRRTSRALKLASDSSYRFERGVDPVGVERASLRAAELIVELTGGKLAQGLLRMGARPPQPARVSMRVARCQRIVGVDLAAAQMVHLLSALELEPRLDDDGRQIHCKIPTHRLDLDREIDLIEEVVRLHGLQSIPVRDRIAIVAQPPQPRMAARQLLGQVLEAHGYHETINFTFLSRPLAEQFLAPGSKAVLIDDRSRHVGTRSEPALRPSLVPSLLVCRKANQDAGNTHVRLFEVAMAWSRSGGKTVEKPAVALAADVPADGPEDGLRDLRGTLEELVSRLGAARELTLRHVEQANFSTAAQVIADGTPIGVAGLIDHNVLQAMGLQGELAVAELDARPLLEHYPPKRQLVPLPRFPAIERDLSIIVAERIVWSQVQDELVAARPQGLESVHFLHVYRGEPIQTGHKSFSLRLIFRDREVTLRHEQVDAEVHRVVERFQAQLDARLRS